jgi:hypothetical protein
MRKFKLPKLRFNGDRFIDGTIMDKVRGVIVSEVYYVVYPSLYLRILRDIEFGVRNNIIPPIRVLESLPPLDSLSSFERLRIAESILEEL